MSETVIITREQFDKLLYLAEDAIHTNSCEYNSDPDDEDRELMLAMWKLAGKDVPGFFARQFGWKHSPKE